MANIASDFTVVTILLDVYVIGWSDVIIVSSNYIINWWFIRALSPEWKRKLCWVPASNGLEV